MSNHNPNSLLHDLLGKYNLLAVKSEFEAEGSTLEEMCSLSDLCERAKCDLTIKVGGPTAQRDFYESCELGASTILVPMVESLDSLKLAISYFNKCSTVYYAASNAPRLAINIESSNALANATSICEYLLRSPTPVRSIVIGRSDLSSSLSVGSVDDPSLTSIIVSLLKILAPLHLDITVGGSITSESFNALSELAQHGVSAFETRKCTLPIKLLCSSSEFNSAINQALLFEIAWINYKQKVLSIPQSIANYRLQSLTSRLAISPSDHQAP